MTESNPNSPNHSSILSEMYQLGGEDDSIADFGSTFTSIKEEDAWSCLYTEIDDVGLLGDPILTPFDEESAELGGSVENEEDHALSFNEEEMQLLPIQSADETHGTDTEPEAFFKEDTTALLNTVKQVSLNFVGRPVAHANRRKEPVAQRNIEECYKSVSYSSKKTEQLSMGGHRKIGMKSKPKTCKNIRSGKPKMHDMDPTVHPHVKGAIYSKLNREKKKAELEEAKAGKAKAEQEAAFFRERLALRDAFIEQGYGRAVVDRLHLDDEIARQQHEEAAAAVNLFRL